MPVNEFEKQVQQKMDELQLRPSAEVWEEVEKRIRKEKRRRGIILWFFILAILLVGGTGWLFISVTKKQSIANSFEKTTIATDKKINETKDTVAKKVDIRIKKLLDSADVKKKIQSTTNSLTNNENNLEEISEENLVPAQKYIAKKKKLNKKEIDVAYNPKKATATGESNETVNEDPNSKINGKVVSDNAEVTKGDIKINAVSDSSVTIIFSESKINSFDSSGRQVAIKKGDSLDIKQEQKITIVDTAKKKKSKWEIWMVSSGGFSNNAKGFGVNGQKSLANYQNMSPAASFVTAPVLIPTSPTTGFMWQTGFYAMRILNNKISMGAGLNFSSYSTKQITGVFVNSSGSAVSGIVTSNGRGYYRSGMSGGTHTNHYYYLELPVSFHWQLNEGKKLPLIWQNGFATEFFLGGNALVYNSGSNIFYKDNKSFNKIQFSYQSNLYVKLFKRNSHPITAGALFNYQLSKLQKINISGGNHLSSFGIQVGWLLKK